MLYLEQSLLSELITNVEPIPEECCGFLIGHQTGDERTITKTMVAENKSRKDKHRYFEIAPLDYLNAENFAAQNNLELLGIYHSHPNHPAVPSEHDRAAAYPNFSYVILSVIQKKFSSIRSWRLNEALQFEEEKISDHNIHQSTKINGNRIHSDTPA